MHEHQEKEWPEGSIGIGGAFRQARRYGRSHVALYREFGQEDRANRGSQWLAAKVDLYARATGYRVTRLVSLSEGGGYARSERSDRREAPPRERDRERPPPSRSNESPPEEDFGDYAGGSDDDIPF